MGVIAALEHLAQRVPALCAMPSNNRHWTATDLEAVEVLVGRCASREQIALARIEGMTEFTACEKEETLKRVHFIARRGLGLQ